MWPRSGSPLAPNFRAGDWGQRSSSELTSLASKSKVKKLLARIVTNRPGVITAFEKAGFSHLTVLKNYVKDLHKASSMPILPCWSRSCNRKLIKEPAEGGRQMKEVVIAAAVEHGHGALRRRPEKCRRWNWVASSSRKSCAGPRFGRTKSIRSYGERHPSRRTPQIPPARRPPGLTSLNTRRR